MGQSATMDNGVDAVESSCGSSNAVNSQAGSSSLSSLAGAAASLTFGKQQPVGYESDAALASQLQAQEDSAVEGLVADIYSDDGGGKDPVAAAASRKNDRELGILSDEEIMGANQGGLLP